MIASRNLAEAGTTHDLVPAFVRAEVRAPDWLDRPVPEVG